MPKPSYKYQTEDDITVGLIHSIIASASALKGRNLESKEVKRELINLVIDGNVRSILQASLDVIFPASLKEAGLTVEDALGNLGEESGNDNAK